MVIACFDELPLEIQLIKGYLPAVAQKKYDLAAAITIELQKQQLGERKSFCCCFLKTCSIWEIRSPE